MNELKNKIDLNVEEILKIKNLITKFAFTEEVDNLKLGSVSIENRLVAISKNIKSIESTLNENNENYHFQNFDSVEKEKDKEVPKFDERMDSLADEFNEKISSIRESFGILKSEFNKVISDTEQRLKERVSKDEVIELENNIYKELDKIVTSLNKKIGMKIDITKFTLLDDKFRKFISDLCPTNDKEDALFSKMNLAQIACASCDKEVTNLYEAQQKDLFRGWNKYPKRNMKEKLKLVKSIATLDDCSDPNCKNIQVNISERKVNKSHLLKYSKSIKNVFQDQISSEPTLKYYGTT